MAASEVRKSPDAGRLAALPPVQRALRGTTSFTVVFALLVAAVPLLLFGAWLIHAETVRQRGDIDALMRERVHNLVADLDSELRQQIQVVQTLAALPALDDPDLPLFYRAAVRARELRPHWVAIALANPIGGQVLNTLRPLGDKLPPLANGAGAFETVRTGEAQVWLRMPVANSQVKHPLLNISAPVIRFDKLHYVVIASIDNDALEEFLVARKLPPGWVAALYGPDGTTFVHTREPAKYIGQPAPPDFAARMRASESGVVKRTFVDGRFGYSSFQRTQFAGITLALHAPADEVERAVPNASMFIWIAGLAALVMTLALAALLTREMVRRRAEAQTQHLLVHTQQLLARQEILLREVHHRVKNNLQTMASMVRIVARKGTPESQPAFQDIARRIATLGHAYDHIHKAEDMARLDLGIYLKSVTQQIATTFSRDEIEVMTVLDNLPVDIDTALPVGLIAGELVTNAFKHAFGDDKDGRLTVKLRDLGEYAMLTVRDTGPGITGDPFSASAGLRIADALASQIDGRLKAKNHPIGGAQFRLTFPVERKKKKPLAHATGG